MSTFNIKSLTGTIYVCSLKPDVKILEFKKLISEKQSVPIAQIKFIFKTNNMDNNLTLGHYEIAHGDTIHLVFRAANFLEAGG